MTLPMFGQAEADIADDLSTTAVICVDGFYFGSFEELGDSDWIAITLEAGVTYTFNLGPDAANANVVFDTTLGLYDASSTLLAFNDDAGETSITSPGVGGIANPWNTYSFIEFTPIETGTYYLAAGTLDGAYVGDYVLSAFAGDLPDDDSTPAALQIGGASVTSRIDDSGDIDSFSVATVVGEYYTVSVAVSGDVDLLVPLVEVRGADGVVINRTTNDGYGDTQLTFQASSTTTWLNVWSEYPDYDIGQYSIHIEEASPVDAIEAPEWPAISADVKVYFIEGDQFVTNFWLDSFYALAWTQEELDSAFRTFQHYMDVANVTFTVVDDPAAANLLMVKQPGEQPYHGIALSSISDDKGIDGVSYTADLLVLASETGHMAQSIFAPGTLAEYVLIHELGHHLGLSHPHWQDEGGAYIPGVIWPYEYGDLGLNQGAYTVMTYNPGLLEKDGFFYFYENLSLDFGATASPMAFDIAAVQQIYGANTTTQTGDDTYVLPDDNALGTGYFAIWDNGGTDTIAAAATNTSGVTIDLRAATLDYDKIGGGAVSWAHSVQGGFTIANGVVIENAIGGAGDDRLVGNEANNRLEGGDGDDELGGGAGDDRLFGGDGNDRLFGDVLPGKPSGIGFGSGFVVSDPGANNDGTALDITNAFALFADPDVADSDTVPHVTITGTGSGDYGHFFAITLAEGATITFDMDHTSGGLDAGIYVYNSAFDALALFDDSLVSAGAGGSAGRADPYGSFTADPYGSFTAWDGGTYYFWVGDILSEDYFLAEGMDYVLHVSVPLMTEAVGWGAGNDYLHGGVGDDWLDGGEGDDTAGFSGSLGDYIIQDFGSQLIVSGPDGNDTLISIEHLTFDDAMLDVTNDGDPLFDALYYFSHNTDVYFADMDARDHFDTYGWREGRDPNAWFDSSFYLAVNPDVAAAGMNPLDHYREYGWEEGRDPSSLFDTTLYLINNPDVAAAGIDPLSHYLSYGMVEGRQSFVAVGTIQNGFDAQYYLFHNPDVAAAGVDPFQHFSEFGWLEGYDPNGWFDTAGYLSHYDDVAAAGVDPLQHYLEHGWREGRDPSANFDTQGYLAAYLDVAAADMDPLSHFLQYGIYEGRQAVDDGAFG